MLKYYLDTEFIEGFRKPVQCLPTLPSIGFNKPAHFIELISIGIRCEDGRSYYAISNEYDASLASDWVKENVIAKLEPKKVSHPIQTCDGIFHVLVDNPVYKSREQIAKDIIDFVYPKGVLYNKETCLPSQIEDTLNNERPSFWAYYADYDWVVFCSLFGTMMELPKGFPMFCNDLKQYFDETVELIMEEEVLSGKDRRSHRNFKEESEFLKGNVNYPEQSSEHHALADADWNVRLHDFLKGIRYAVYREISRGNQANKIF